MADDSILNDPEIIKEFVNEFREHIQNLDKSLLDLEKDPENAETIQIIFRMAHNIKGSSSYLGLKKINHFTHKLENILDGVRKGATKISPPILDVLFRCVDVLRQQIDAFVSNGSDEGVDIEPIMNELERVASSTAAGAPAGAAAPPAPMPQKSINDPGVDLEVFIVSVSQHLDSIEVAVGKLKAGEAEGELWDRLHRAFSGIKTAASVMGFSDLQDLMEKNASLVDSYRTGQNQADGGTAKMFEAVLEIMRKFLEDRKTGIKVNCQSDEMQKTAQVIERVEVEPRQTGVKSAAGEPAAPKAATQEQSIRVSEGRIDKMMNLIGELVVLRNRFMSLNRRLNADVRRGESSDEFNDATEFMNRITDELQGIIMDIRLIPISTIFNKFPRMVRDYSKSRNKKIDLIIEGQETEVDKTVIEKIGDPLGHLVRNAIDHGIEPTEDRARKGKPPTGNVKLRAFNEGDSVVLEISDDGKGMDPEILKQKALEKGLITKEEAGRLSHEEALNLIFIAGFSTAKEITDVSGRGVGMDVVKDNVRKLNGQIFIKSEVDKGSVVTLRLPLTLAIVKVLMVNVDKEMLGIPLSYVSSIVETSKADIYPMPGSEAIFFQGQTLVLASLAEMLDGAARIDPAMRREGEKSPVVVLSIGDKKVGFRVDKVMGQQDVVIKPLEGIASFSHCISGSAILGDGKVALIVNPNELLRSAARSKTAAG